jgi:hypothetical protein
VSRGIEAASGADDVVDAIITTVRRHTLRGHPPTTQKIRDEELALIGQRLDVNGIADEGERQAITIDILSWLMATAIQRLAHQDDR